MRIDPPQPLISDPKGRIINAPGLEAAGMKGGCFFRLPRRELIRLPAGSRLFMLPARAPVGYDPKTHNFITLHNDPISGKSGSCFAVAAFLSPGFTVSYNSPYAEIKKSKALPLFSYAAAVFYKGGFYAAAVKVDRDIRHDPRFIDLGFVRKGIAEVKKQIHRNRLITHLERCALAYYCPNAQNFFLGRYEAPLPASPLCNAACAGCISYQPRNRCPSSQPRIKFIPTPEEIAQIALFHIGRVKDPIVSFGQGCEGEPLLAGDVIGKAVRLIRSATRKGIININTNASRPEVMSKLFDAGLDSMRVSLNSAREEYYARYYKPRAYAFKDVVRSVRIAKRKGIFVSINYLTMPGFTDSRDEFRALEDFIGTNRIDMIQWRNLNFDPLEYFRILKVRIGSSQMLGVREIMARLKKKFPRFRMGYFNPAVRS